MLSFHQARQKILDTVQHLEVESVPLLEAAGRAVAQEILANRPLPLFDNSAMDGYAVRAADCTPGTILPITGYLAAGGKINCIVEAHSAVKIMTGAPLPPGADAIVPFEDTAEESAQIRIIGPVKKGDHIRWQGEDIRSGDRVIAAGTVLRPAEISLLAAFGMSQVPVHRRVTVTILAIGDELKEIDEALAAGDVVNSNSWALAAAVREIGGIPLMLGIARDDMANLQEKLVAGLQADALITSAGVSAGDRDLVRQALEELGVVQHFWKINIKPGKPTAFGSKGAVPVFSLPGNPVSTMISFEEFVRPALLKMMGHQTQCKPLFMARLRDAVEKKAGRTQIMRVAIELGEDGMMQVVSSGDQNTGILRTLVNAQGIAILEEQRQDYASGDLVAVHLLGTATALGY